MHVLLSCQHVQLHLQGHVLPPYIVLEPAMHVKVPCSDGTAMPDSYMHCQAVPAAYRQQVKQLPMRAGLSTRIRICVP